MRPTTLNLFGKKLPAWLLAAALLAVGAGAATGLVLKDSISGDTSVAVSQAILVVGATECSSASDADEFLVTIDDDNAGFAIHFEANNGDVLCYDLQIANEAEQIIVAEMHMWGNSPYTFGSEPIFYWTDDNHDGEITAGEAVIDQRTGSNTAILETTDTVVNTGTADLTEFSANHWFFEGGGAYDDGEFSTTTGAAPEAIILDDGDGVLDAGSLSTGDDEIVTAGRADLDEDTTNAIGQLIYYNANSDSNWDTGEDIFLSVDGDSFYSTTADVLLDADGSPTSGGTTGTGSAAAINVGDALKAFDTNDEVYYYNPVAPGLFDGSADVLWLDTGDDGYYNENGQSESGSSPSTNIASTLNPSLDIAFDGGGATTYILENSNAITAESLSQVGVEGDVAIVSGDVVEVGATSEYFIVSSKSGSGQSTVVTLIGDDTVLGDALVTGASLDEQSFSAVSDTGFDVFGAGQNDGNSDGVITLSIDAGGAASITAGDVLVSDADTTLGGHEAVIIAGNSPSVGGGGGATTLTALVVSGQAALTDNYNLLRISGIGDSGTSFDVDDYYLDSGSDIASALDNAISGSGTATYGSAGFTGKYKVDSASTAAASAVVITDGSSGNNVADNLKLGNANGGSGEVGRDRLLRDSGANAADDTTTGSEVSTSTSTPFAYVSADSTYDEGEDIYEEESANALTYTSAANLPETLVYDGGTTDVAGGGAQDDSEPATDFDDGDNVMYLDRDHDSAYDTGEPILKTDSDIDPAGQLTSAVTVLARKDAATWTAFSSADMYQLLEGQGNSVAGKDYKFADDDNGGAADYDGTPTGSPPSSSTYGEAIIDDKAGTDNNELDSGEVVLNGYAMLTSLPMALSGQGSTLYKFEVPSVNDLSNPLEIRITIAVEDAAPTGFYTVYAELRAVNV